MAHGAWRIRLAAQDTSLSRRRPGVRIPHALPEIDHRYSVSTGGVRRGVARRCGRQHGASRPVHTAEERKVCATPASETFGFPAHCCGWPRVFLV